MFDVIQSLFSNFSFYQPLLLYLFLLVALFSLFPIELFHDSARVLHTFPVLINQYFFSSPLHYSEAYFSSFFVIYFLFTLYWYSMPYPMYPHISLHAC